MIAMSGKKSPIMLFEMGHTDVDDVALLQLPLVRNAVTDYLVHGP